MFSDVLVPGWGKPLPTATGLGVAGRATLCAERSPGTLFSAGLGAARATLAFGLMSSAVGLFK